LLVITGVSIAAVNEPKKIMSLGVFSVTCLASIWAYIWVFIVLKIWTPDYVSLTEAVLTLIFFFITIILAFTGEMIHEIRMRRIEDKRTALNRKKKQIRTAAKHEINRLTKNGYKKAELLELAFGLKGSKKDPKYEKIC